MKTETKYEVHGPEGVGLIQDGFKTMEQAERFIEEMENEDRYNSQFKPNEYYIKETVAE